mmetsp:Transcript_30534/g.69884  ORF Transcript_30534/g.69884 Transcript_30534/m.69884 type:complete len:359 (-) Transcript_30534:396-1472(-)
MGTLSSTRSSYVRRANHAGSWYSSSAAELDAELHQFLCAADANANDDDGCSTIDVPPPESHRGIVSPHAGYSYSGRTAAFAYAALRRRMMPQRGPRGEDRGSVPLRTVVVLHPSHHVYLDGCAVSGARILQTPLGDLDVDSELRTKLVDSGKFTVMTRKVDEVEHSGEMQYPYIKKCINDANIDQSSVKILPIMVGTISELAERAYGAILAPYLQRDDTFTVISSDFCHWGSRFRYRPFQPELIPKTNKQENSQIFHFIEWLDKTGMNHISMQDPGAFAIYLQEHSNTICGRHPIGVWLSSIVENKVDGKEILDIKFVKYARSSEVTNRNESSVSYASAVAVRSASSPQSLCYREECC